MVVDSPRIGRNDRKTLAWRNLTRVVIALLLIIVANLYGPELVRFLPLVGVLRFSPIVTEAVHLANEHKGAVEMLGAPIEIGWVVKGYINDFSLSSGESRLRVPVKGSKDRGTLITRASNGQGPWIFSELKLLPEQGESVDLFDHRPDQRPTMVQTKRRVYLIPLGKVGDLGLEDLPKPIWSGTTTRKPASLSILITGAQ